MRFPFLFKILIALLPLITALLIILYYVLKDVKGEVLLRKVIKNTSKTMIDVKVQGDAVEDEEKKGIISSYIKKQNAKLNVVGITYKFETVLAIASCIFIVSAIASKVLFKAGPLLMGYLGLIFAGMVILSANKKANEKKEELTIEFLEKINEISSQLSVGKNIQNAIDEIINDGQCSKVLQNEFIDARQNLNIGLSLSETFMKMYENLQIDEIKTFATTLQVYENTGGNLIEILAANDNFFQSKLKLKNAQRVFITSMKTSQKLTIAIPVAFIIIMVLVNPSFFGDYYSNGIGEIVGILAISTLLLGVYLSNRIAQIKK